ncbi:MAG: MarR family transcriptional regulator [Clostridiaceae bacterium]|jgi:DNA-binding MarR family transcriptional regulator|nr:MarR family transcriptional regulator [Clostridiaceae bacterium]
MDCRNEAISGILDLLKQINMHLSHCMSSVIEDSPLTVHQMFIMKIIRKNDHVNLTPLSKFLGLSKASLSLTIKKMVEEGYVSRIENRKDRRSIDIVLTKKGEEILDVTFQKSLTLFNQLTTSFSTEELNDIKLKLQKLDLSIQAGLLPEDRI